MSAPTFGLSCVADKYNLLSKRQRYRCHLALLVLFEPVVSPLPPCTAPLNTFPKVMFGDWANEGKKTVRGVGLSLFPVCDHFI